MTEYAVNRLPAVEDGKLIGIDLVRDFTRTDAENVDEIRDVPVVQ